jgi:hypothetical protein
MIDAAVAQVLVALDLPAKLFRLALQGGSHRLVDAGIDALAGRALPPSLDRVLESDVAPRLSCGIGARW